MFNFSAGVYLGYDYLCVVGSLMMRRCTMYGILVQQEVESFVF